MSYTDPFLLSGNLQCCVTWHIFYKMKVKVKYVDKSMGTIEIEIMIDCIL